MTIFSEIYGTYFRIAASVLSRESISSDEINDIIIKQGFNDSILFLPQKLMPRPDQSDWGLLKKQADKFIPVIKNKPVFIMTRLQKMWLKAIINDPRIRLFLNNDDIKILETKLFDVKPLYTNDNFSYTDRFTDGDDYENETYIKNFRTILFAMKEKRILNIQYTSGHGHRIGGHYVPFKIEYSPKNDKFRVYCYWLKRKAVKRSLINIARIDRVNATDRILTKSTSEKKFFEAERCKEPVLIRLTAERNAVERFMMEFASYEKHTERDLDTGICTVKMWYDGLDETEILIRLLSYGPVLEILGPPNFRRHAAERVFNQAKLSCISNISDN